MPIGSASPGSFICAPKSEFTLVTKKSEYLNIASRPMFQITAARVAAKALLLPYFCLSAKIPVT